MGRLVGLAVLAFVLYQGYTKGLPWIKERLDIGRTAEAGASASDESTRCVDLAERADATLVDTMRQFSRPPVDQLSWSTAFISINGDVGAAESACYCGTRACDTASRAVSRIRNLAISFDGIVRGNVGGMFNPAAEQERILELLEDARHELNG